MDWYPEQGSRQEHEHRKRVTNIFFSWHVQEVGITKSGQRVPRSIIHKSGEDEEVSRERRVIECTWSFVKKLNEQIDAPQKVLG